MNRGSYKKGLKNGKGVYKTTDGDIYDGEFMDDKVMLLNPL